MRRRQFTTLFIRAIAALSLSGFLAVNSLWVQSYFVADCIKYADGGGAGGFVTNYRGAMYFYWNSSGNRGARGFGYARLVSPMRSSPLTPLLTGQWQVVGTHVGVPHWIVSAILAATAIGHFPIARRLRVCECPTCGCKNSGRSQKCAECGTQIIPVVKKTEMQIFLRRARLFGMRAIAPVSILGFILVTLLLVRSYVVRDSVMYSDGHSRSWEIGSNSGVIQLSVITWKGQSKRFYYNSARGSNIGDESRSMFSFEHNERGLHIRFPHLFASILFAGSAILCLRAIRRAPVNTGSHCVVCGYDLRASPERCPECGTEVKSIVSS